MASTLPSSLSPSTLSIISYISYVSLAVQGYRWVNDLPFEVEHIWHKRTPWTVKCRYIVSRYGGLLEQAIHAGFFAFLRSSPVVPLAWCTVLHYIIASSWAVFLLLCSISLRDRVLAQYKDRYWLNTFLSVIDALEFVTNIVWTNSIFQRAELRGTCLIWTIPPDLILFEIVLIGFQSRFWVSRYFLFNKATSPLSGLAIGENFAILAIFAWLASLLTSSRLSNIPAFKDFHLSVLFQSAPSIAVAMLTSIDCYLIKQSLLGRSVSTAPRIDPEAPIGMIRL